jgi:hypothetical protein
MTFRMLRDRPPRFGALLLAVACLPAWSGAAPGLVPQHTEILRPAVTRATGESRTLEFSAYGRAFRLQLAENPRLAQLSVGSTQRLYKGTLDGAPDSWARLSLRDGLPRGVIWDGRDLYIVDAAPDAVNDGAAGTVMFKLADAALERGVSFMDDAVDKPSDPAAAYDALIGELRTRAQAVEGGVPTEGVAISVLGDAAFLARYAGEAQARDAILARLNIVDGIFNAQLGIELQVVSVDIAAGFMADLSTTTESSPLLESLGQLRQRTPQLAGTGLTHLFTGRSLNGDSAGVAYTLALCSPRFGASLAMAHNSATLDALITAHEIGHVFGAPHDGADQCASTPQNQFIMTPTLSTAVSSFSSCSVERINAVRDSYSCLVALPAPGPAPPAPPAPTPPPDNGGGGGGGGGGGAFDPAWLLFLFSIGFAQLRRGRSPT